MSNPFKKLIQDSKDLPTLNAKSDTVPLNRELDCIDKESKSIASKFNTNQDMNATGHYFLAQSGANSQETTQYLKNMDLRLTFRPEEVIKSTNVEAHLKQVQETYKKATVEQLRSNTTQAFSKIMNEQRHSRWKAGRVEILQESNLEQDNKMFGYSLQGREQSLSIKNRTAAYMNTVKDINMKRLVLEKIPIVSQFAKSSNLVECSNVQRTYMTKAWDIASQLTGENGKRVANVHINQQNKTEVINMRRSLVGASKQWLEKQYYSIANNYLEKNAHAINVGGSPSIKTRLFKFMNAQFRDAKTSAWSISHLEIQEDTPIWLFTFILMRCGFSNLALEFVEKNSNYFSRTPRFVGYFRDYHTKQELSEDDRKDIRAQYRLMKYSNEQTDPFKLLLFKIIGRCELDMTEPILNTIEDFIWLRLTLIREPYCDEEYQYERYRLADLQAAISNEDKSKFDRNGLNPWFYFNILLLSLQFERAVSYLYSIEQFRVEAVHFAIAFAYYGLLRIPEKRHFNTYDLLITEFDGSVSLNFSGLIEQYVRLFVPDDSIDALQYFYLLTLYSSKEMQNACREQVCRYAANLGDCRSILGYADSSAFVHEGLVEKYKPLMGFDNNNNNEYTESILLPVAEILKNSGKYKESVAIYTMINKFEEAFDILNNQIDRVLTRLATLKTASALTSTAATTSNDMHDLISFCLQVAETYHNRIFSEERQYAFATHCVLLRFLQAASEYNKRDYNRAIEFIGLANIFPLTDNYQDVFNYANRYNTIEENAIHKHVPEMMMMCIEREKHLRSMELFLGLISSKLPSDAVAELNRKLTVVTQGSRFQKE